MCPPQGNCIRPLLLGEKMKKFECRGCGPREEKCVLLIGDNVREPARCPLDGLNAVWRQVIRVEVVSNGVAPRL